MSKIKRNTLFDVQLYFDMLRQLRMWALIWAIPGLVITAIPHLFFILAKTKPSTFSFQGLTPFLYLYMIAGGVTLVFCAFSFLNHRPGSDFYHGIPQKRTSIALSSMAAIVSWILVTVVAHALVAVLGCLASRSSWGNVNFLTLISYFFAGTTLIASVAYIAVSLTGTRLSNLALTAIVLLLPRFILIMMAFCATYSTMEVIHFIPEGLSGLIFSHSYNIPLSLLPLGDLIGKTNFAASSNAAILYTLTLSILYIAFGTLAFRKRKSETAGQSAPSRIMQHVFRCLVTLPFTLVIFVLFSFNYRIFPLNNAVLSPIIILFIISLVVYFLYELITTKRFKNLPKAIPYYGVLLVVSCILCLCARGVGNAMLNNIPAASEIDSVGIYTANNYNYTYTDIRIQSIYVDSPELASLVASNLEKTVAGVKDGSYGSNLGNTNDSICNYVINLKNGRKMVRTVRLPNADALAAETIINQSEAFHAAVRELPTADTITNKSITVMDWMGTGLPEEFINDLWESFSSEMETLSDADFAYPGNPYLFVPQDATTPDEPNSDQVAHTHFARFEIIGKYNGLNYYNMFFVSDLTPKTSKMLLDYLYTNNKDNAKAALSKLLSGEKQGNVFMSLTGHETQNQAASSYCHIFFDTLGNPEAQAILQSISTNLDSPPLLGQPVVFLVISSYVENTSDNDSIYTVTSDDSVQQLFVGITPKEADSLTEAWAKYNGDQNSKEYIIR